MTDAGLFADRKPEDSETPKALTSADMFDRLAAAFPPPAWALLSEVRSGTGAQGRTFADALAFGLWPSRGLEILGFEIKVSRSDWLREMRDPAKADEIARFCHGWYLVVSDRNIVREGELPPAWGLIVAKGSGLNTVKGTQNPFVPPEPGRVFLASVMRNVVESHVPRRSIAAEIDRVSAQVRERRDRELEALKADVAAFEAASGVSVSDKWDRDPACVGRAVALVLKHGPDACVKEFERFREDLKSTLRFVESKLAVAKQSTRGKP